jgi:hypothetical protein
MKYLKIIAFLILIGSSTAYADQNQFNQYSGSRGQIDRDDNQFNQYGGSRGQFDRDDNQ